MQHVRQNENVPAGGACCMKTLKINIPVILLILFEVAVGILLLVKPESFTAAVITCFGIILIAIGIVYLIRYLRDKKAVGAANPITLMLSILALIIGCICALLTNWVLGLFAVVAVIFGVILIICGVYKVKVLFDARKEALPVSFVSILSAILSVILGVIIVVNPFAAAKTVWRFVGLSLLTEAVIDFIAVTLSARGKQTE